MTTTLVYDFTGWLCADCHLATAGYSAEEIGHDFDPNTDGPMSLLEAGTLVTPGIRDADHECEDRRIGHVALVGCGEESRQFDTSVCDGCASHLAGARYAATFWHAVTTSTLSTADATTELARAYAAGEEISDRCAAIVAAWFASPGVVGRHLAALATGATVDLADVLEDIERTRRDFPRDYAAGITSTWRHLDQLATWAIRRDA